MDNPSLRSVSTLEALLSENEWLVGGEFSVADVAVGSYLNYVPIFFPQSDLAQTPNIARYMARCASRPAFAQAFGDGHAQHEDRVRCAAQREGFAAGLAAHSPSPVDS